MAATEVQKQNLIQTNFRRASLTDNGIEKIAVERIPGILGQMGQHFDQNKLQRYIRLLDPLNTGYLALSGYNQLCKEFVRDPAALAKVDGDEFTFKHLITKNDFASP